MHMQMYQDNMLAKYSSCHDEMITESMDHIRDKGCYCACYCLFPSGEYDVGEDVSGQMYAGYTSGEGMDKDVERRGTSYLIVHNTPEEMFQKELILCFDTATPTGYNHS